MFVGGVSALIPERNRIIAAVGFRAMIVATLTYMMTACVAGVFFNNDSILPTN
ncbi:MAG: nucleoside transporter C-terminal domain-containing protein [Thermodesulfobacteriota bacterium]